MINGKKVLAVVLARAGSKGIPMKNVRDLLGKPLFLWSVEAALQSKYVDEIIISSNCDECAKVYLDFIKGVDIDDAVKLCFLHRPENISGDKAKNESAVINALEHNSYNSYDVVIQLQPTSPVRSNNLLDKAIEEYEEGDYDSLLTADKETPFIWQKIGGVWHYTVDTNDYCDRRMRQEFEEEDFIYHDNGCIYITDVDVMMETECRIGSNPCVFETFGLDSLQIDEEHDFLLIEQTAKVKGLKSLI